MKGGNHRDNNTMFADVFAGFDQEDMRWDALFFCGFSAYRFG